MGDFVLEPGMKVESLRTWPTNIPFLHNAPVAGNIYTVREVKNGTNDQGESDVGVWLVELVNRPCQTMDGFHERGFPARYFRPLRNRSTSIEIFREIVDEVKRGKIRTLEDAC